MSRGEQKALKTLGKNLEIVIRQADKGGSIVIQDYEDYNAEAMKILSDTEYYTKVEHDPFPQLELEFQKFIKKAAEDSIITKEELKFIHVPLANKPFFYHLPKIHKHLKCPAGRPIISGLNSTTSNISHYIDLYLQTYVRGLKSHLKDSDHLIRELLDQPWNEEWGFLTMDVTSLYSNIEHTTGIECMRKYLREDLEISETQEEFLVEAARSILEKNYFMYNQEVYHQRKGTAMGTRMAPSYANLFMGASEDQHIWAIEQHQSKIILYKQFIDDLLFLWNGNKESALKFTEELNSNTWGIKFTPKFNKQQIEFLDLIVKHENGKWGTATYFKEVDANSYISFKSNHLRKWKENIPYGQLRRVRKNCTSEKEFKDQAEVIQERLCEKGYPRGLVLEALKRASNENQQSLLTKRETTVSETPLKETKIGPHNNLITRYNTGHGRIREIL